MNDFLFFLRARSLNCLFNKFGFINLCLFCFQWLWKIQEIFCHFLSACSFCGQHFALLGFGFGSRLFQNSCFSLTGYWVWFSMSTYFLVVFNNWRSKVKIIRKAHFAWRLNILNCYFIHLMNSFWKNRLFNWQLNRWFHHFLLNFWSLVEIYFLWSERLTFAFLLTESDVLVSDALDFKQRVFNLLSVVFVDLFQLIEMGLKIVVVIWQTC